MTPEELPDVKFTNGFSLKFFEPAGEPPKSLMEEREKQLREIDRKVAEAMGLEISYEGLSPETAWNHPVVELENGDIINWRPSTDWNDAMFAAELAGLFDKGVCIMHHGPDYSIVDQKTMEAWGCSVESLTMQYFDETGPLAICQAILKEKS